MTIDVCLQRSMTNIKVIICAESDSLFEEENYVIHSVADPQLCLRWKDGNLMWHHYVCSYFATHKHQLMVLLEEDFDKDKLLLTDNRCLLVTKYGNLDYGSCDTKSKALRLENNRLVCPSSMTNRLAMCGSQAQLLTGKIGRVDTHCIPY